MTIPSYKPGHPNWRDGFETALRQAFELCLLPGDPAHRIAAMVPKPPMPNPELDEMRERFAAKGRGA